MGKFVLTTDSSIGGYQHKNGNLVLFKKINDLNVVEVIEDIEKVKELIEKAAPILGQIWQTLVDLYMSIVEPFPPVISKVIDGETVYYRFTEQRSRGKAIDFVFYMNTIDRNDVIYEHHHEYMPKAKKALKKQLREEGYKK